MNARPAVAMLLAAGRGTRLGALGTTQPKPLVRVGGRALIDHALDEIAAAGVMRAVINIHHLPDQMRAHLAARGGAPAIAISDETDALLETGGGVVKALPLLSDDVFFVLNSDVVRPAPSRALPRLADAWDTARMEVLLLIQPRDRAIGFDGAGDYRMDGDGRLHWRGSVPDAPFVYAGAAICHRRVFAGAPAGAFSLKRLFDAAEAAGRLHGLAHEGAWLHVGTPDGIVAADAALAAR